MGDKFNIKNINVLKDKNYLSSLNYTQLYELSNQIRSEILRATSLNGGHLSSNLGVVELTIALHRNFDFTKDKLLFDVGHQCYTHKILTGRDISKIRNKDEISGFIKNKESPFDIYESGHSSTSISAAYAFALDRDIKKEKYNVVCLIGDSSISNGISFEALNNASKKGHKFIIILNDNNMSISSPVGRLSNAFRSMQISKSYQNIKKGIKKILIFKPLYSLAASIKKFFKKHLITPNIFDCLGYTYLGVIDGHNFKSLDKVLKKAKHSPNSVIVHVKTKKGYGYSYAENDSIGLYHGIAPFDIATGNPKNNHPGLITWSKVYSNIIIEKLKNDDKFYLICPGTLTGSELNEAKKMYPNRIIDVGIAEEHAVVFGAYLAKQGYHVGISIYSTFMQRAIDYINHDAARINAPIVFFVDRSGLVGQDGETHQGIYDESYLIATPNVHIYMATNKEEARLITDKAFNSKQLSFIRYPRSLVDETKEKELSTLLEYRNYKNDINASVALIGNGPLMNDVANLLKDTPIDLFFLIKVHPLSKVFLTSLLKYQKIVIYAPYECETGYPSTFIRELSLLGFKGQIFLKSIPTVFVEHAKVSEQLSNFGLLPNQIYDFAINLLSNK